MHKHRLAPAIVMLVAMAAAASAVVSLPVARAATPVATLYFTTPASPVLAGGAFSIAVMINASQPLNAYSVQVNVTGGAGIQYLGADNAHSLISVWQSLPSATPAAGGGMVISFGGGSLTPFEGRHGELMTLNFEAEATGTVALSFGPSYVYLANGKGTKVAPATSGASAPIGPPAAGGATGIAGGLGGAGTAGINLGNATDTAPPAIAYLAIIGDPESGSHKLLGFQVTDSGSGVRETDVRYRTGLAWSDWQAVTNPVSLTNGVWEVDFRATDNAGNTTEQTLYDWNALLAPIALIIIIAAATAFIILFMRRRRGSAAAGA